MIPTFKRCTATLSAIVLAFGVSTVTAAQPSVPEAALQEIPEAAPQEVQVEVELDTVTIVVRVCVARVC